MESGSPAPTNMSIKETVITEAAKAAPPSGIAVITGNEVLIAVSIVYVLLQIAHLIWKWNKERKNGKGK